VGYSFQIRSGFPLTQTESYNLATDSLADYLKIVNMPQKGLP
jgi:hypothetical protein